MKVYYVPVGVKAHFARFCASAQGASKNLRLNAAIYLTWAAKYHQFSKAKITLEG